MRLVVCLIIVFLGSLKTVDAQDLIVTGKGDSLNCKITKIKSDYIYFTFRYEYEIRNTLLPVDKIKFYKKDYFAKADVPIEKIKNFNINYQKFRIGFWGGWSYMTAQVSSNVPSGFQDYIKELKSGYHFGGDASFFISENIGFGIKYSMFKTKNQRNFIYVTSSVTGQVQLGSLKDDITIQYLGPALCSRIISANNKTQLVSDLSLGYLSYKNNATVIDNFILTGGTIGLLMDIGVDFAIDKNISLGFSFAYILGTLNQYDFDDGKQVQTIKLDKDNLESISRIDISAGLKWNLK